MSFLNFSGFCLNGSRQKHTLGNVSLGFPQSCHSKGVFSISGKPNSHYSCGQTSIFDGQIHILAFFDWLTPPSTSKRLQPRGQSSGGIFHKLRHGVVRLQRQRERGKQKNKTSGRPGESRSGDDFRAKICKFCWFDGCCFGILSPVFGQMIRSCAAESLPQNGCEDGDTMALVTEYVMALSKKRETPKTARISLENDHPMGFFLWTFGVQKLVLHVSRRPQMEPYIILCGRTSDCQHLHIC